MSPEERRYWDSECVACSEGYPASSCTCKPRSRHLSVHEPNQLRDCCPAHANGGRAGGLMSLGVETLMRFFANPCGRAVVEAMQRGDLGFIATPAQGNRRPEGVAWVADNGAFSDNFDERKWSKFLRDNAHDADTCLFAVAPDVVGDAVATLERSVPLLPWIRSLGYPAALVAQDGLENLTVPWDDFDVLFIGGTTTWKLGGHARHLVAEAKARGKWVHMGRVNSERRYEYARAIGCDSADGTYLVFGPDTNLPKLLAWTRNTAQDGLFIGEGA